MTGNLAHLDHLKDNSGSLAGLFLTHKPLRREAWLQGISIDAEAANVRMGGDEVKTPEVFGF